MQCEHCSSVLHEDLMIHLVPLGDSCECSYVKRYQDRIVPLHDGDVYFCSKKCIMDYLEEKIDLALLEPGP